MATFVVTVYEVHKQRVRVEAASAQEALIAVRDGDGDYERRNGQYVTEFVETADLGLEVEADYAANEWQGRVSEPVPSSVTKLKAAPTTAVPKLVGERGMTGLSQDHDLSSRWEVGQYKIRVSVHLDASYAWQSRCHAEVWREADISWQGVAALHHGEVPVQARYQMPPGTPHREALLAAEAELLVRAAWALGVS